MKISECIVWLWRISISYRSSILANSLTGIARVGVSLFFIWVCKCLMDIATGHCDGSIFAYAILMMACPAFQLALGAINVRIENWSEIGLRNLLRDQVFKHVMESHWLGRGSRHSGDIASSLTVDVSTVSNTVCRNVPFTIITIVQLVGAMIFLLMLDARLALILAVVMPVALLFSKIYVCKMRRLNTELRKTDSMVQQCVQESVQNRILIRTMEFSEQIVSHLRLLHDKAISLTMQRTRLSLFSNIVVQSGFATGYVIAFLWGIYGLKNGAVTFGMMTAFLQLVSQVQRPTAELSRQFPAMVRSMTSAERLNELLSLPVEKDIPTAVLTGTVGLRLSDVSYTYPGNERPTLSDFTHDFTPGTMTAIVGVTGAGKSTLFRLILALIYPDKGKVAFYDEYNNVCIASVSSRQYVSYVPQGNSLMSGTIRDNLLMGNPSASDDDISKALYASDADFVHELPDGLDSRCGEQGIGLSEGQAQRIAIARGLLRPGNVLLLDEPTSFLDPHTGKTVLERLSRQCRKKTIIIITHNEHVAQSCHNQIKLHKI
ncbi:MAG: ABC transporter ATP-binding protein [Parabacteroides sp.]|nr:ABC transporter ATP-binding protein [Parabacteroides sp.]